MKNQYFLSYLVLLSLSKLSYSLEPDATLDSTLLKNEDFSPSHIYTFILKQERCFHYKYALLSKEELLLGSKKVSSQFLRGMYFVLDTKKSSTVDFTIYENESLVESFPLLSENEFIIPLKLIPTEVMYKMCFSSRNSQTKVTFAFDVEKHYSKNNPSSASPKTGNLEETIFEDFDELLESVKDDLKHLESEEILVSERQRKHMNIQDSTEFRVNALTLVQILATFLISIFQIRYLKKMVNQRAWV
eukprot:snap_masked-scaffold_1-processed-gene-29.5-mRNA-1 protein AED:1.00 eAED:1.00 QI:0/-1/0/0/-1/1/1/0/245